jgi:hypothetical protein
LLGVPFNHLRDAQAFDDVGADSEYVHGECDCKYAVEHEEHVPCSAAARECGDVIPRRTASCRRRQ